MNYRLHPEAASDLREAAEYYRERAGAALAQAFLTEFENSIQLLLQHPLLGAPWLQGKRRLVMHRFPYTVVYFVAEQEIRVLAVAHQSRRPGYWRRRKW
jgi:plasmid stabilization system protein ParE